MTVGIADGSIIAAIITIQIPRNQPSVPRAVHGPEPIPSHPVDGRPPREPRQAEEQHDEAAFRARRAHQPE